MNVGELVAKGGAFFLKKKLSAVQAVYYAASASDKSAFQASVSGARGAMRRVGVIGDSRTANIWSRYGTYDRQRNAQSWINQALPLAGHPFDVVGASVEAGWRTDQYLAGLNTLLADSTIDTVIIGYPCLNDISQDYPAAATSATTAFANLSAAVNTILLSGRRVIALMETGSTDLSLEKISRVMEFNRLWLDFFQNLSGRGAYLFDTRSIEWLPNSGSSAQAFRTGFLVDNAHRSATSAQVVAKAFIAWAQPLGLLAASKAPTYLGSSSLELYSINSTELGNNPLFATLTGGSSSGDMTAKITGNIPSAWDISSPDAANVASVAITSGANADGYGNDITLTVTATSGGWCSVDFFSAIWSPMSRIPAGSFISVGIEVEFVSGLGGCPSGFVYPNNQPQSQFCESYDQLVTAGDRWQHRHVVSVPTVPEWCTYGTRLRVPASGSGVFKVRRHRASLLLRDLSLVDYVGTV